MSPAERAKEEAKEKARRAAGLVRSTGLHTTHHVTGAHRKLTPTERAHLSAALKGKHHPLSAATKAKIRAKLKADARRRGHHLSAEARAKISAAMKRYYATHPAAKERARKRYFAQLEDQPFNPSSFGL